MRSRWIAAALLLACTAPAIASGPPMPPEQLGRRLANLVREVIPRQFEDERDWGRTKSVTRGLKFESRFRSLSIHRRKKDVPHGVWRRYRVSRVDAPDSFAVAIRNLRSLEAGRAACTVVLSGELDGWARVRHYNRGVHLGTITFEGRSTVRVEIDCEVGVGLVAGERLPALAFHPVVTAARIDVEGFHLNRIGELKGDVPREIGRALKSVAQDRLNDIDLAAKLNRAIDRRREKLRIDPSELIRGMATPPAPTAAGPGSS